MGAGYWGPNLIRNAADLGVLDSVCDADPSALAPVRAGYPQAFVTTDFAELLRRPLDGVIIAAPAHLHAPMAMQALAARKHVFVEKPLALTTEQGEEVARAARAAGRQVFVGHLLLYHPAVKKMRALIGAGDIGDVYHVRSRRLSLGKLRRHETVWWSFAPHDVAVVLALMGEEPVAVSAAQTAFRSPKMSDVAYADFQFSGGRTAHIEVCWLDPQKSARLDVFGSAGVLTLEDSRQGTSLRLTRCGVSPDNALAVWRNEPEPIPIETIEPLKAELQAFLKSMATGQPSETDAEEGLAVIRSLKMADDAALHSAVDMPVPA